MNESQIQSLADLINSVLNDRPAKADITISHHVNMYLSIFFKALNENKGDPVPYDSFREQLWLKLAKDRLQYKETIENFSNVWSGWVHLYRYMKDNQFVK